MSYFIFGGTGFIGTHLVKIIKASELNAKIYNLDIDASATNSAEFIHCDVRKPINISVTPAPDDVIFNFAAVHRTPGHPDYAYFETNIQGATNICDFARKYGIRKIVFTSSIAPYGAAEDLKTEDTLPTPNTPYGISKLVAEKIHQIWAAEDPERELTIMRPGVVFGCGEHGNFTRMYWGIRNREFAYPGRRDTIKACIYVKDLIGFMLHKLNNHKKGTEIFNCTFEPAFTIEKIVETMKNATGLNNWTPLIPSWILMPMAYIAMLLGSPMGICPARVRKLMISTNISGKKLSESGYVFKYTLEEAIRDWMKDSGGEGLK